MLILIVDHETTGLDPEQGAKSIEIAAMLYDAVTASSIASFSSLINAGIPNAAEHVNRISQETLVHAPSEEAVWGQVRTLASRAETVVAHRAEFDRKFSPDFLCEMPWICTKVDVDWPGGERGDHLTHLALAYGLGVASAHRAMTDVDTIARIFTRVAEKHDLVALLKRAMRPKKTFHAIVAFEHKELVKRHGFLWNPDRRVWYRNMPPEDAAELPFRTREAT